MFYLKGLVLPYLILGVRAYMLTGGPTNDIM